MNEEFISNSAQETREWAKNFSDRLVPGDVICLHGDLGAGKTTWVKGLAEGLGLEANQTVTSPTFVIMHRYPCRMPLYHFDCYRLESSEDLLEVGFDEFVNDARGIICVEWPEKAGDRIPAHSFHVSITAIGENARKIQVKRE